MCMCVFMDFPSFRLFCRQQKYALTRQCLKNFCERCNVQAHGPDAELNMRPGRTFAGPQLVLKGTTGLNAVLLMNAGPAHLCAVVLSRLCSLVPFDWQNKKIHSLQSLILQNKTSESKKIWERATFPTLCHRVSLECFISQCFIYCCHQL